MESTGEAGMIQVSEATANLLIAADKEHWLTPREDAIKVRSFRREVVGSYEENHKICPRF